MSSTPPTTCAHGCEPGTCVVLTEEATVLCRKYLVTIKIGTSSWVFQRRDVERESRYLKAKSDADPAAAIIELPEDFVRKDLFALFAQYINDGYYDAPEGPITLVNKDVEELGPGKTYTTSHMTDWAIAAWIMGYRLDAPYFINLAMNYLYYHWPSNGYRLHLQAVAFASEEEEHRHSPLKYFFQRVILAEWGNSDIIDHDDPRWAAFFDKYPVIPWRLERTSHLSADERRIKETEWMFRHDYDIRGLFKFWCINIMVPNMSDFLAWIRCDHRTGVIRRIE